MINQTENQQVPKNVNLSIKPIALFFIREALLKLVEISIREKNSDNQLILLYKCEESLEVVEDIDLVINQLSLDYEKVFCNSVKFKVQ